MPRYLVFSITIILRITWSAEKQLTISRILIFSRPLEPHLYPHAKTFAENSWIAIYRNRIGFKEPVLVLPCPELSVGSGLSASKSTLRPSSAREEFYGAHLPPETVLFLCHEVDRLQRHFLLRLRAEVKQAEMRPRRRVKSTDMELKIPVRSKERLSDKQYREHFTLLTWLVEFLLELQCQKIETREVPVLGTAAAVNGGGSWTKEKEWNGRLFVSASSTTRGAATFLPSPRKRRARYCRNQEHKYGHRQGMIRKSFEDERRGLAMHVATKIEVELGRGETRKRVFRDASGQPPATDRLIFNTIHKAHLEGLGSREEQFDGEEARDAQMILLRGPVRCCDGDSSSTQKARKTRHIDGSHGVDGPAEDAANLVRESQIRASPDETIKQLELKEPLFQSAQKLCFTESQQRKFVPVDAVNRATGKTRKMQCGQMAALRN
ncbi:hypothetical protein C8R45DRAFT_1077334 [Mycena sanguinolenta]|nr:hypothetical protein C8R45DRAFT_1077334 [Mycena sanguinolenta]